MKLFVVVAASDPLLSCPYLRHSSLCLFVLFLCFLTYICMRVKCLSITWMFTHTHTRILNVNIIADLSNFIDFSLFKTDSNGIFRLLTHTHVGTCQLPCTVINVENYTKYQVHYNDRIICHTKWQFQIYKCIYNHHHIHSYN